MFNFLLKNLLKKKLEGYPPEFVEGIFDIFQKNPEFFKKVMSEVDTEMKRGSSQEDAVRRSLDSHQKEIMEIFAKK